MAQEIVLTRELTDAGFPQCRDVNEPGPSPQARKPAGTFPSPPGPQPAFFSPHLQIRQKKLKNNPNLSRIFFFKKKLQGKLSSSKLF